MCITVEFTPVFRNIRRVHVIKNYRIPPNSRHACRIFQWQKFVFSGHKSRIYNTTERVEREPARINKRPCRRVSSNTNAPAYTLGGGVRRFYIITPTGWIQRPGYVVKKRRIAVFIIPTEILMHHFGDRCIKHAGFNKPRLEPRQVQL